MMPAWTPGAERHRQKMAFKRILSHWGVDTGEKQIAVHHVFRGWSRQLQFRPRPQPTITMRMWKAKGDIELDLWTDLPPSFVGALCRSCSHIWPREGSCFHVQPREGYSSHIWPREGFSSRVQPKVGFCPRAWPGEGFCSWVQFWEPGGLCPQVQPGEGLCSKGSPGRDFVPECSPESPEAHKCPPSRTCSHHLCGGITAGLPVSIGIMAGGSPVSASSLWIQDSALACRPNRSTMAPSSPPWSGSPLVPPGSLRRYVTALDCLCVFFPPHVLPVTQFLPCLIVFIWFRSVSSIVYKVLSVPGFFCSCFHGLVLCLPSCATCVSCLPGVTLVLDYWRLLSWILVCVRAPCLLIVAHWQLFFCVSIVIVVVWQKNGARTKLNC